VKKESYSYTVLRYVHDVATGEALNLGVVLHAPASRYLGARLQTNAGRLKEAYPGLDGKLHRALIRSLQTAFDAAAQRYAEELPLSGKPDTLDTRIHEVLRPDDSSLQWGAPGGGLCADPARELEWLYDRLVLAHDRKGSRKGRSDDVVWGQYRMPLQRAKVLSHLKPRAVLSEVEQVEVDFPNAWQNGCWHYLQPFSLDLVKIESIRDKAHRFIGEMAGLGNALRGDHLYLMLGEPSGASARKTMDRSLNLIHASLQERNLAHDFIYEAEAESFAQKLGEKMRLHLHGS
jgi:hypothetical protein